MESKLEQNVTAMMSSTGASGITVADSEGVRLHSAGKITDMANVGSLMIADAKNMFPKGTRNKKNSYPIVTLHSSDGSKTTVANKHGETVSIHFQK
ncbi:Late endosomal/lysosomal adaptor and MAPK and MTOR activator 5 [Caenorhabditis elegans]|uniref:Late endosomal/lysosomal adaptor and MAPK and MTOR activator 5 n=1 Tax=Caenorhabditis elegans TaxID=6239 RepID=O17268_CAEEL|nr:Late endosomal/lysosomal adaptor and MAPK and MTOR activator 5 [Caenorhabditis elegans]CCD67221.1 Late endosomal/lysosomal adaptor and MAPK and MTOR activator 5 [Caenorhabditis elegans]|eukprot:NP_497668.2 Late endosomal/lysosomal adaptor, Mapk (MAPK) and mToR (MTOR) activator homolog [Caenorhabditis elegans]